MITQEDKKLLLKDLCARLPYGVVCVGITYGLDDDGEKYIASKVKNTLTEIHNYKLETASVRLGLISSCELETVKPYLRSMSSMTEEEKEELLNLLFDKEAKHFYINGEGLIDGKTSSLMKEGLNYPAFCPNNITLYTDWLNAHHLDYRGLIEKGLAIAVKEENNPYKD